MSTKMPRGLVARAPGLVDMHVGPIGIRVGRVDTSVEPVHTRGGPVDTRIVRQIGFSHLSHPVVQCVVDRENTANSIGAP